MINVQCEVNAMQAGKQSYDVEHKIDLILKMEHNYHDCL